MTGWIRTLDPRPIDALALVAIDLTVHIRADLPHPAMASDDSTFAEFLTNHVGA